MTQSIRNKTYVWLVYKIESDAVIPIGVTPSFRRAYKAALFAVSISSPSVSERAARAKSKPTGVTYVWDSLEFNSFEEALYSPIGRIAKLEKIAVIKS